MHEFEHHLSACVCVYAPLSDIHVGEHSPVDCVICSMSAKMAGVLDNGAHSLKLGLVGSEETRIVPNAVFKSKSERRRVFVGSELEECKDLSGLFFIPPFQKGYLVNWDIQRQVWDHAFGANVMNFDCSATRLLLTEPLFNFPSIRVTQLEVLVEEYGFPSLAVTTAPTLSSHHYSLTRGQPLCCLVVDAGYSFTHIVPHYHNKVVLEGVRRVCVGGKLLSNHLKELVSYRQLQVLDETYVMGQVKEDACFVSLDLYQDMQRAKRRGEDNTTAVEYVLPNFTNTRRGFIRKNQAGKRNGEEQCLRLGNERFAVPELLFHPADIGIQEMGVAEAICNAILATPTEMHPHLFSNIVLTGGSANFPNFKERIQQDVRALTPAHYTVSVHVSDSPQLFALQGGQLVGEQEDCGAWYVSAAELKEKGAELCIESMEQLHTVTFLEQKAS